MAKKKEITTQFKIQAPGGQATPAPPIGPALGQHGVNPGQFIQQFNERTRHLNGKVVGCVITVYKDRSFDFEIKSPPAAVLIKDAIGAAKGSGVPNKEKIGKVNADQLRAMAQEKAKELTGHSVEAMMRTLAGTARSMGVEVEGFKPAK
jgi:large subunit ribosomal protein L11